jgi:hypothetical protein
MASKQQQVEVTGPFLQKFALGCPLDEVNLRKPASTTFSLVSPGDLPLLVRDVSGRAARQHSEDHPHQRYANA